MPEVWIIALLWAACALCMVFAAAFTALTFAVASYKFSANRTGKRGAPAFGAAVRFCVSGSAKIATTLAISVRAFVVLAAFFAYFAANESLECLGLPIENGHKVAIAFAAGIFAVFFEYGILGIPAARYAAANPEKILKKIAPVFIVFYAAIKPFELCAAGVGLKLAGKKIPGKPSFEHIDVEVMLRSEDSDGETISPYAGKIVRNAIRLQDLDVSDVMLPRSKVVYFDTEEPYEENIKTALETRHNRYPLCKGDLDNCYGIIHLRDLFACQSEAKTPDLKKIARQTLRLRENEKLESALVKMLRYKIHIALVEDDFGGVIGVLTLDAALGELVGQIRDEFTVSQGEPIRGIGKNKYKISGLAPIRRVEDFLDTDFDTDEVSTFGGLITFSLGRFPEKGERIYFKEQHMRVVIDKMDDKMVGECTVTIEPSESAEE